MHNMKTLFFINQVFVWFTFLLKNILVIVSVVINYKVQSFLGLSSSVAFWVFLRHTITMIWLCWEIREIKWLDLWALMNCLSFRDLARLPTFNFHTTLLIIILHNCPFDLINYIGVFIGWPQEFENYSYSLDQFRYACIL